MKGNILTRNSDEAVEFNTDLCTPEPLSPLKTATTDS